MGDSQKDFIIPLLLVVLILVVVGGDAYIVINQNQPITYTTTTLDASGCTSATGKITAIASGGANTYNYSKNGGVNYQAYNIFASLLPGTYSVKVKDILGCSTSISTITVGPACRTDYAVGIEKNSFTVYPNPTSGNVTIVFSSASEQTYNLRMMDVTGRMVFAQEYLSVIGGNHFELNLSDVPKGLYLVLLQNEDGVMQQRVVVD